MGCPFFVVCVSKLLTPKRNDVSYTEHQLQPDKQDMKTPIQKLIEELEMMRDESDGHTAEVHAYTEAIEVAEAFIKDEADAMQEKYAQGWADAFESYFFKRFKKNLETSPEI